MARRSPAGSARRAIGGARRAVARARLTPGWRRPTDAPAAPAAAGGGGGVGLALAVVGIVVLGISLNSAAEVGLVAGQVPFLVSGGITGIGLVVVGGAIALVEAMRRDAEAHAMEVARLEASLAVLHGPSVRPARVAEAAPPATAAPGGRTAEAAGGDATVPPPAAASSPASGDATPASPRFPGDGRALHRPVVRAQADADDTVALTPDADDTIALPPTPATDETAGADDTAVLPPSRPADTAPASGPAEEPGPTAPPVAVPRDDAPDRTAKLPGAADVRAQGEDAASDAGPDGTARLPDPADVRAQHAAAEGGSDGTDEPGDGAGRAGTDPGSRA